MRYLGLAIKPDYKSHFIYWSQSQYLLPKAYAKWSVNIISHYRHYLYSRSPACGDCTTFMLTRDPRSGLRTGEQISLHS